MTVVMKGVTVTAGDRTLLKDVSLDLPAGQVTGLIGPNGAGKSTLLAALSGDIKPQSGSISIRGINPYAAKPKELARVRSVMLQDVSVSFLLSGPRCRGDGAPSLAGYRHGRGG